jgi:uncharacterized membrane protein
MMRAKGDKENIEMLSETDRSSNPCDETCLCCGKEIRIRRIALFAGILIGLCIPIAAISLILWDPLRGFAWGITMDILISAIMTFIYSVNHSMQYIVESTFLKALQSNARRLWIPLIAVAMAIIPSIPLYFEKSPLSPAAMMLILYGMEAVAIAAWYKFMSTSAL